MTVRPVSLLWDTDSEIARATPSLCVGMSPGRGCQVTVAELQLLLLDLGRLLRASAAAVCVGQISNLSGQVGNLTYKAFADFLVQAEAYSRGALAPKAKSAPAKKGKADSAAIEQACQDILDVYANAIDPTVTLEQIEATVRTLEESNAMKPRLDELARQMGYSQKFRSKPDVLKAIRQKNVSRKGAFERQNA